MSKQIHAGYGNACTINTEGQVYCWGKNSHGELGNGGNIASASPVKVEELTDITQITGGYYHNCALAKTGKVYCWGDSYEAQLGKKDNKESRIPLEIENLPEATQISAGAKHTCALDKDGKAYCWGRNYEGQLGSNDKGKKPNPSEVQGISDLIQISAGEEHTCALTKAGKVYCWGKNDVGQLGNNQGDLDKSDDNFVIPVPVEVHDLSDVAQISTGGYHTCALTKAGKAHCWGSNKYGRLGDGTEIVRPVPVEVTELSDITQISAGSSYSCALTQGGKAYCWGTNGAGQLGNGEKGFSIIDISNPSLTPVEVQNLADIAQISTGTAVTCAITKTSKTYCWGANTEGQLGNGMESENSSDANNSAVPVEVAGIS